MFIQTDKGSVRIEVSDPRLTVSVDGDLIDVDNLDQPLTLRTGEHTLSAKYQGMEVETKEFSIQSGEDVVVKVEYTPVGEKEQLVQSLVPDPNNRPTNVPLEKEVQSTAKAPERLASASDMSRPPELQEVLPATQSSRPPVTGDSDLLDVQRLFAGTVERFDPTTRYIVLNYDFSDPKQQQDWTAVNWKELSPEESWGVENGKLRLQNTDSMLLLKPVFGEVKVTADFAVRTGKGGDVCLVMGAQEQGILHSFYGLMGLWNHETCALRHITGAGNWLDSKPSSANEGKPSPFASKFAGHFSLQRQFQDVVGRVGEHEFKLTDSANLHGRVGVWAQNSSVDFDNIRVEGILALGALPDLEDPPHDSVGGPLPDLLSDLGCQLNHWQSYEFPIHVPSFSTNTGLLEVAVRQSSDNSGDRGMHTSLYDSSKDVWLGPWYVRRSGWHSFYQSVPSGSAWKVRVEDNDTSTRNPQPHNYIGLTVRVSPQILPVQAWRAKFYKWDKETSETDNSIVSEQGWKDIIQDNPIHEQSVDDLNFYVDGRNPSDISDELRLSAEVPNEYFALVADARYKLPAGKYRFLASADDGVRVEVNGEIIIEPPHQNLWVKSGSGRRPRL